MNGGIEFDLKLLDGFHEGGGEIGDRQARLFVGLIGEKPHGAYKARIGVLLVIADNDITGKSAIVGMSGD